jgi:hypothetical protein
MSVVGDADAVDRCARTYQRGADRLHEMGEAEVRWYAQTSWKGPRADKARRMAEERRDRFRRTAAEMHQMSDELRRHATWIREREAHLRRLETRIRRWAAAHPPRPDLPGRPDASLIRVWPGPYSDDWERLAARLRANGAVF